MFGALVGLVVDADDQQEVGRALGDPDALLLDLLRKARDRGLDRVLDLDLGDVGIGALFEDDADRDLTRASSTTTGNRASRRCRSAAARGPG